MRSVLFAIDCIQGTTKSIYFVKSETNERCFFVVALLVHGGKRGQFDYHGSELYFLCECTCYFHVYVYGLVAHGVLFPT